jgi:excisionase family DNA binding protein
MIRNHRRTAFVCSTGTFFDRLAENPAVRRMLSMRQSNQDVDDDAPTLEFVLPLVRPIAVPKVTQQRDGLWDANDVAGYLKVSRSWVYHRAEGGHLPHLRIGGLLRFDPEVVRAFAKKK